MLVVGSYAAIAYGVPLGRTPKDLDLFCTLPEMFSYIENRKGEHVKTELLPSRSGFTKFVAFFQRTSTPSIVEFEIQEPGNTAHELGELIEGTALASKKVLGITAVHPNVVYALKRSHAYLGDKQNPHFQKTRKDIGVLEAHGCAIPDELKAWFRKREKATYNYKVPSLERNKQNFFNVNEGVPYIYDHDSIHEAVAYHEHPAYTYFQRDGHSVAVDRNKWENLPEEVRLNSVLEESYVLALERMLIPGNFKANPDKAFLIALQKVCTTIASGWWREYAWRNYDAVVDRYSPEYVAKFHKAKVEGRLRPYITEKVA